MPTTDEIVERVSEWKQKVGLSSKQEPEADAPQKSLLKGAIAGLIGGLVATAAKSMAEKVYPPRTHGEPEPPDVLADKITGHSLDVPGRKAASEAIHWGFGAMTGAAYGAIAEFYPAATSKEGASFGLTLATLTHESALPALGLSADAEHQTTREHTSEMATHVVYGVVTEIVRGIVRRILH